MRLSGPKQTELQCINIHSKERAAIRSDAWNGALDPEILVGRTATVLRSGFPEGRAAPAA
ncbi:hypothetical protein [Falsirhodobacter sp. 1013]|uniref:hypothetical protein n=1 Tax=Falsirhodobacter sp. 1013 TaxID=3417566 RepID=UPI003EBE0526